MTLKAILVEDEKISREILHTYLTKYCPSVTIVGEAENVLDAVKLVAHVKPDIVFLDVEMPYGNAFDFMDALPERDFETVFVTAYDHYAKDALNHQAAYYLVKPIEIEQLILAVDRVMRIKSKEREIENQVLLKTETTSILDKITIPTTDGFEILAVKDIIYCQADNNYTHIFLKSGKKLVSKTLLYFDDMLSNHGFCRIHKSYLINTIYVTGYKKGKGGSVMLGEVELHVSPSRKIALFEYFS